MVLIVYFPHVNIVAASISRTTAVIGNEWFLYETCCNAVDNSL